MDFNQIIKYIETNSLNYQFLYSDSLEKHLTKEDFDKYRPEDENNAFSYDLFVDVVCKLTQKEQQAFLKWLYSKQDFSKSVIDKIKGIDEYVINNESEIMEKDNPEMYIISIISDVVNKTMKDFSGIVKTLPAPILKKVIVKALDNGLDIVKMVEHYQEQQEKVKKEQKKAIVDLIKNSPDELTKVLLMAQYKITEEDLNEE